MVERDPTGPPPPTFTAAAGSGELLPIPTAEVVIEELNRRYCGMPYTEMVNVAARDYTVTRICQYLGIAYERVEVWLHDSAGKARLCLLVKDDPRSGATAHWIRSRLTKLGFPCVYPGAALALEPPAPGPGLGSGDAAVAGAAEEP